LSIFESFVLIVLIVVARYVFPSKMTFLVEITTFSIYIIANDILYGYMGMVSFGQPFYLGVGAYTAAIYWLTSARPAGRHFLAIVMDS